MTIAVKSLFFVLKDGKVLLCESNLKDLVDLFPEEIADIRSYDYYYRQFKKSDYFVLEFNRAYQFQKMEFNRT